MITKPFPINGMYVHDIGDDIFSFFTEPMLNDGIYFKHICAIEEGEVVDVIQVCYFDFNERNQFQKVQVFSIQECHSLSEFQIYCIVKELYELYVNSTKEEFLGSMMNFSINYMLLKHGEEDTTDYLDNLLSERTGIKNALLEKSS